MYIVSLQKKEDLNVNVHPNDVIAMNPLQKEHT